MLNESRHQGEKSQFSRESVWVVTLYPRSLAMVTPVALDLQPKKQSSRLWIIIADDHSRLLLFLLDIQHSDVK